MGASVAEQILASAAQALAASMLVPVGHVKRGLAEDESFGEDELPLLNLRRSGGDSSLLATRAQQNTLNFALDIAVAGADWETRVDALHVAAETVLFGDAEINRLGRGLQCVGDELSSGGGDFIAGKLVAQYQIRFITRPGDLTRTIS